MQFGFVERTECLHRGKLHVYMLGGGGLSTSYFTTCRSTTLSRYLENFHPDHFTRILCETSHALSDITQCCSLTRVAVSRSILRSSTLQIRVYVVCVVVRRVVTSSLHLFEYLIIPTASQITLDRIQLHTHRCFARTLFAAYARVDLPLDVCARVFYRGEMIRTDVIQAQ